MLCVNYISIKLEGKNPSVKIYSWYLFQWSSTGGSFILQRTFDNVWRHFLKIYFYFWLHWVFVAVCGLSLVAMSGGYSLVAMLGLLIAVASLFAEHGLQLPEARGIFPDQGSNLCPLIGRQILTHCTTWESWRHFWLSYWGGRCCWHSGGRGQGCLLLYILQGIDIPTTKELLYSKCQWCWGWGILADSSRVWHTLCRISTFLILYIS